jgi:hypothetical protein
LLYGHYDPVNAFSSTLAIDSELAIVPLARPRPERIGPRLLIYGHLKRALAIELAIERREDTKT